ncbi:MAG TPA: hypothetical protein VJ385_08310 [Fibrobacteria bacterium]|nr:hypothetical protein [Fibrobacteria bacterium]
MVSILKWLLSLAVCAGLAAEPPLLICLPGGHPPLKIESVLNPAISPWKAMAFSRMRDLEAALSTYPKSPVITSAAYARYLQGYEVRLKGKKGGAKTKKYVLLAAKTGIDNANLARLTVGVLDFLGREKLPPFVHEAFSLEFSQLKRVGKQEDLLSLLGMESVDAIVIEENDLADFEARTKLPLSVLLVSKSMDSFPVLVVPGQERYEQLQSSLMQKEKEVGKVLKIEGWE